MTASTEQERAEFEAWARKCCYDIERVDGAIQYTSNLTEQVWMTWQAARRAPVVLPDQLPPDAAKRAMEALQTDVETLRRALAECRDAFPVPAPGSKIEPAWMQAMGHAEAVPDYMRAIAAAPLPPEAETDSLGIPKSYGKPLCSPRKHHPLCDLADHIPAVGQMVAAPAQLPEPQAEIEVRSMKTYLDLSIHEWRDTLPDGTYKIYTEPQVRQLLAPAQEPST